MTQKLGEKKSFEKQVLRIGKWKHDAAPNGILNITKEYLKQIADNFSKNPFVPVYRGHVSDDEAARNPNLIVTKNINSFKLKDDGLYAEFEMDKDEADKYNDVSLSIQDDYEDHESGLNIGAVARHVALVPSPYIKGLQPFLALKEQEKNYSILLSEINMADKEETKVEETKVEETPVVETTVETPTGEPITETPVEEAPKAVEPVEEVKPTVDNSESSEDIRIQLEDLRKSNAELTKQLTKQKADTLFNKYLNLGKALPTMKNDFISLASVASKTVDLADGKEKSVENILESLFAKMPVMINLSEKGVNPDSPKTIDVNPELIEGMRKSFFLRDPDATEDKFQEYIEKNMKTIKEYN